MLLKRLGPQCRKFTNKRLISYTQSKSRQPRVQLYFQDGSTEMCDVLIGADGVKSTARNCLVEELAQIARSEGRHHDAQKVLASAQAKWSGTIAYRSIISAEKLRGVSPDHRVLEHPMLVCLQVATSTIPRSADLPVHFSISERTQ